jgi:hypothetical protein
VAGEERTQPATAVDDKTTEVAPALFDHLEDQITRTDTKAQVVLAADAILLSWYSMQNPTAVQALLAGHVSAAARASALLIVLVFVGLFLSLASGLVVIWLRAGASARSTLVNFGGIARRSEPDFVAAFLRQSREEVTQTILPGVHATARIAHQKFRWVGVSVASLLATLAVWTALEVLRLALPQRAPHRAARDRPETSICPP